MLPPDLHCAPICFSQPLSLLAAHKLSKWAFLIRFQRERKQQQKTEEACTYYIRAWVLEHLAEFLRISQKVCTYCDSLCAWQWALGMAAFIVGGGSGMDFIMPSLPTMNSHPSMNSALEMIMIQIPDLNTLVRRTCLGFEFSNKEICFATIS